MSNRPRLSEFIEQMEGNHRIDKRPLRLHPSAEAEIEETRQECEAEEPGRGERFIKRVDEALAYLSEHALCGKYFESEYARRYGTNEFPFSLWYELDDDGILVFSQDPYIRETTRAAFVEIGRREGRQQEAVDLLLRLANKRFGPLGPEDESRIRKLPLTELESLSEALLDFGGIEDLRQRL